MPVQAWRARSCFWVALAVYCLVALVLSAAVSQASIDVGLRVAGPIAGCMMVVVTLGMCTHRGDWPWPRRVGFAVEALVGHAVLTVIATMFALPLMAIDPFVAIATATLLASLPFVTVAMKVSRLFVEPVATAA